MSLNDNVKEESGSENKSKVTEDMIKEIYESFESHLKATKDIFIKGTFNHSLIDCDIVLKLLNKISKFIYVLFNEAVESSMRTQELITTALNEEDANTAENDGAPLSLRNMLSEMMSSRNFKNT